MPTPGGTSNKGKKQTPRVVHQVQIPGIDYVFHGNLNNQVSTILNDIGPPVQAFQDPPQPGPEPTSQLIDTAEELARAFQLRPADSSTPIPRITQNALRGYLAIRGPPLSPNQTYNDCANLTTRYSPVGVHISLRFNHATRLCAIRGFSWLRDVSRIADPDSTPVIQRMIDDLRADVRVVRDVADKVYQHLSLEQRREVYRRVDEMNLRSWELNGLSPAPEVN